MEQTHLDIWLLGLELLSWHYYYHYHENGWFYSQRLDVAPERVKDIVKHMTHGDEIKKNRLSNKHENLSSGKFNFWSLNPLFQANWFSLPEGKTTHYIMLKLDSLKDMRRWQCQVYQLRIAKCNHLGVTKRVYGTRHTGTMWTGLDLLFEDDRIRFSGLGWLNHSSVTRELKCSIWSLELQELKYPPVSSNMAGWKPWTIEISDFPMNTSIPRGFSSQPCLMTPEGSCLVTDSSEVQ